MKLCLTILKQEDLLDTIIKKYQDNGIYNITVIDSTSIVKEYRVENKRKVENIIGTFRHLVDYVNDDSVLIMNIVQNEKISVIKSILTNTVAYKNYNFFTIDINYIDGEIE